MTEHAEYFDNWRTPTFKCGCGWSGLADAMASELRAELSERSCPTCGAQLLLVLFPTGEDVRRAAAAGNAEAKVMLVGVIDRERRAEEWARNALVSPSQLPEVAGDRAIEFVWDIEKRGRDNYYVIRAAEQLVWAELAHFEDWERFQEVKAILKDKYDARFQSLTATWGAQCNLIGDCYHPNLDPH